MNEEDIEVYIVPEEVKPVEVDSIVYHEDGSCTITFVTETIK